MLQLKESELLVGVIEAVGTFKQGTDNDEIALFKK